MSDSGEQNSGALTQTEVRKVLAETDRLVIAVMSNERDAQSFFEISQDTGFNQFSVTGYRQTSVDEASKWLQGQNDQINGTGFGAYGLFLKQSPDQLIGICALRPIRLDDSNSDEMEIMYRLIAKEWGKGYATEAAQALLEHALAKLKLSQVIAFANRTNIRSRRVISKLGMNLNRLSKFKGVDIEVYAASPLLGFPRSKIAIPRSL